MFTFVSIILNFVSKKIDTKVMEANVAKKN